MRPEKRIKETPNYFKYIDFMSTVVEDDYKLLSSFYPEKTRHIKYVPFNYGGFLSDGIEDFSNGENILIGNSANYDNNHIETFRLLKNVDFQNRKVIVPLSYGGNESYRKYIIGLGYKIFGKSFYPLLEFLPKNEYNKIIDSVDIAFMNHSHQHAMGNINRLLAKGVKVYMDKTNTAYQHHKRLGINLFDINNINYNTMFSPLNKETKIINKKIIMDYYSRDVLQNRTRKLVDTILQ